MALTPRRWLRTSTLLLMAGVLLCSVHAEAVDEYKVKAAVLYNLAKFVEWPPDAFPDSLSPVVFCVLGVDPFGTMLDETLANHLIGERQTVARRVSEPAAECRVLFIASSEARRVPAVLDKVGTSHVLTVSDATGFAERGGMIGLVSAAGQVHFEINMGAAERAGLAISSRLAALASSVLRPGELRR